MTGELLLALWVGLGAMASAAEPVDGDHQVNIEQPSLTQAQAGAFYEATHFSLDQVGAQHLLRGMDRETFVEALLAHVASAAQADRAAVQQLQSRWGDVREGWTDLPATARRGFVYEVIAVAYGPAIADELVNEDTFVDVSSGFDLGIESEGMTGVTEQSLAGN